MPSPESRTLHRSYLYAPGSRPDVMEKAVRAGADAVVLDLEDAVAPEARADARLAVSKLLDRIGTVAVAVHVRVDRDGEGYSVADLEAVVRPGLGGLRLPKAEEPEAVAEVADRVTALERERGMPVGGIRLYPTVESARGVAAIERIGAATPRIARFSLGAADLLADLGIARETPESLLALRSELVLRSRLARVGPPIDSVHTRLDDDAGLRDSAERARALGFFGKSVVHPAQLAVVHEVFTPTEEELEAARRIVRAGAEASARGVGALQLEGQFVDAPVVARAQALLEHPGGGR